MIVNSLWIGSLGNMERMSMISHLQHGHCYRLWTYQNVVAPEGVEVRDANEILSAGETFTYQIGEEKGSFSAFSNVFRYKLLLEQGGWWCDTDVVCLKPFNFTEPYVFASERYKTGSCGPTTCVICVPPSSDIMNYCWEKSIKEDRRTLRWGTIGPSLLMEAIFHYQLERYLRLVDDFCPINWFDIQPLFLPGTIPDSYAVHLWNEIWRRQKLDKEATFPQNCIFEQLKSNVNDWS